MVHINSLLNRVLNKVVILPFIEMGLLSPRDFRLYSTSYTLNSALIPSNQSERCISVRVLSREYSIQSVFASFHSAISTQPAFRASPAP